MSAKRKRRTHGRARAAARLARSAASVRSSSPLGQRLRSSRSLLLVVDVQERVAAAVCDAERIVSQCAVLIQAASLLGVPVIVTEHCPEQLGATVTSLRGLISDDLIEPKVHFSAADEPALAQRIALLNRPQVVVAGMESHVCVLQTALGLAERGYRPHVVIDATGSRREESRTVASKRLQTAQIPIVTTEMVVFEWLESAEHPELRQVLSLIK